MRSIQNSTHDFTGQKIADKYSWKRSFDSWNLHVYNEVGTEYYIMGSDNGT